MIIIKQYSPSDKIIWNEFVKLIKSEHFFFYREYMDYHSERFKDHSLMFFDEKNTLLALLPANISDNIIYSHQGLTFGGLLMKASAKQKDILEIFYAIKEYLKSSNYTSLIYKKIPYIYNNIPNDEDLYGLFKINAKLFRRDISSTIKIKNQIKYSKGRKWIVKKAKDNELVYSRTEKIDDFWENLCNVLSDNHNVKPIHSLQEIKYLYEKFPNNIKFYTTTHNSRLVSGAVIFEVSDVAHTQYLYNTYEGREVGALDGLIDYLVKEVYSSKEYFDFGISNENQGQVLNEGLIAQKEGFGARAVAHDFFEIKSND
ncbi:GNAT family N-acetyltransferase [Providencia rettgeri]|uniref:GNAT family N-acetyltransferase n=1 Tax=Providencia rettgeri TaxID=587 RepID=UPI002551D419|nr:GNAT family N-acetyltransferase [Providencia rettgeri]MDK7745668.1 GNAT family N-acetyltransferase [Providencia rettgeri]MDK7758022.1 GNAT family N-acetyltransferase [Providencia rettgeri]